MYGFILKKLTKKKPLNSMKTIYFSYFLDKINF
jgi:hypothetical protein